MDKVTEMFKFAVGGVITALSGFIGGIDGVMYALIAFMSLDYVTGVAAAVKHRQLSSETGFWGLVRKVCVVALVGVGHFVDVYVMHTGDIFRTAVALYYIGNEGVSLLENIGMLGVVLPKKLIDVLEQIRNDNSGGNDDENN
ncbi:MAG: phage holin family protein [Oscillospiraceae bacterium]|nr:phage holin family protein [Oscillospiraceae bacterium]